jgi:hypothetical protein
VSDIAMKFCPAKQKTGKLYTYNNRHPRIGLEKKGDTADKNRDMLKKSDIPVLAEMSVTGMSVIGKESYFQFEGVSSTLSGYTYHIYSSRKRIAG